ncbi:MAG: O-antigen ligase family protein [Hyphomicrobiaceae bacterium]
MHNNRTTSAPSANAMRIETLIPALGFLAILLALLAPRTTPALLALLTVPALLAAILRNQLERARTITPLEAILACLGLYLALNATWSVDKSEAFGRLALFVIFALTSILAFPAYKALEADTRRRLQIAILVAFGIGAAALAIECAFNQPVRRWILSTAPLLRPSAKHLHVMGNEVTRIGLDILNRNVAMLMLILWPAIIMLRAIVSDTSRSLLWIGALGLVSAVAVFTSEHQTSMIAIIASLLVFLGMKVAPRTMKLLVLAGWITATVLVVPIASTCYSAGLYKAGWIPETGRNRIVLWGVTAQRIQRSPILGIGIKSIKPLDEAAAETALWPKDHPYPLRTGRHSHNIFMQTWFELGAVGAAFLLAIGLATFAIFQKRSSALQPYLYSSFTATTVIGAFSWGLWQPWFMAAFAIWAVLLLLAGIGPRTDQPASSSTA